MVCGVLIVVVVVIAFFLLALWTLDLTEVIEF